MNGPGLIELVVIIFLDLLSILSSFKNSLEWYKSIPVSPIATTLGLLQFKSKFKD